MIESGCVLDSYWYAQLTIYPGPYPGPLRCARYNLQNDVAEMEAAARHRQVRAAFDDTTIIVYQAYSPEIADPALSTGRFVAPFKRDRMTWIKPSFLWMMYRCGWATKPGQERVLAVEVSREGFDWALEHSALSHYDPSIHPSHAEWERSMAQPVRIQWDPERDLHFNPLPHRAIQIGLGGEAVDRYVDEWVVSISDVTSTAQSIGALVDRGLLSEAAKLLPAESIYPLRATLSKVVGATG